ncbi:type 1 glutamine amidotransferase domain-containing protein [Corynebacterium mendelii]|uniref:Type 1 glutamine amidotransferase n=1 Tax=Corynebacterium mendelii TaxID=2765362 RepID=A0A939IWB8_9CORY|nr:type 1 glutamine amidotransferase domain-containing protein [Corynebacterium mendelii]MBN9645126.1 type 1 glutamine amidotransferase [Corynebacterium mendelii]
MENLSGKTVAVIATHGFEDSELTEPVSAVTDAGATVHIISTETGEITGKKGHAVTVDKTTAEAAAGDYDALILPGGTANSDTIRMDRNAVGFVRAMVEAGKPTGVICHGGWILTDAGVLKDRVITSYPSIKTDLINAGATWVDEQCHVDQGLVSSRTPADLPAFNAKLIEEIAEGTH